jgi:oligopeptide transport system permease protein
MTSTPVPELVVESRFRVTPGRVGAAVLMAIAGACLLTLPWSLQYYDLQRLDGVTPLTGPSWANPLGADELGRSLMWRMLLGGAISLGIGVASAAIAVVIGVMWGTIAGYMGGRVDAVMMRIVDVLYGLPYVLLVVMVNLSVKPFMAMAITKLTTTGVEGKVVTASATATTVAEILTLLIAIGGVSWLTMARVIRGQVLSLRSQPFMEAARALGLGPMRTFFGHLLPNLISPIVVYATLTVPSAILQESFLSFLSIGVRPPTPSWGNMAAEGVLQFQNFFGTGGVLKWWVPLWPCLMLAVTLLALNYVGDGLREKWDPRSADKRG